MRRLQRAMVCGRVMKVEVQLPRRRGEEGELGRTWRWSVMVRLMSRIARLNEGEESVQKEGRPSVGATSLRLLLPESKSRKVETTFLSNSHRLFDVGVGGRSAKEGRSRKSDAVRKTITSSSVARCRTSCCCRGKRPGTGHAVDRRVHSFLPCIAVRSRLCRTRPSFNFSLSRLPPTLSYQTNNRQSPSLSCSQFPFPPPTHPSHSPIHRHSPSLPLFLIKMLSSLVSTLALAATLVSAATVDPNSLPHTSESDQYGSVTSLPAVF